MDRNIVALMRNYRQFSVARVHFQSARKPWEIRLERADVGQALGGLIFYAIDLIFIL